MIKSDFDVIIIGGGPAGAVSSIYLSRSGLNTAVIERTAFPRETLCGEFLSLEVIEQLRQLDLEKKFLSLEPNRINSFSFVTGKRLFNSELPFESFSLKRSIFDEFLLNEAVNSGSNIFQPAEVREIVNEGNRFIVRIISGGETEEISSRFVIGAFGKYNLLDKKLKRKYAERNTGYHGIKFHLCKDELSSINDSCIYIYRGDNIYAGVNSVGRGEVTFCFLRRKKSKFSPSEHLAKLFEENPNLAVMFNNVIPDLKQRKVYGAGSIYFGRKELVKNGIIMVGDAAKIIAPLAGDGIGMAFQSAKIASDIIREANEDQHDILQIEQNYNAKWKKHFLIRTSAARIVQNILLKKSFMNLIPAPLIRSSIPLLINATRK